MKRSHSGFTLIELIIVIIILGMFGAVAVPKYIELSSETKTAATNSAAALLAAANAVNYSSRKENTTNGNAITNCTDVAALLQGGIPAGYTIASLAVPANSIVSCTLTGSGGKTATFSATGIP